MTTTNTEYFGIQRKIVANMTTESWQNIPHVTYMYEPDVTKFFKEYKKLNQNRSGDEKITFNTLMLKVITEGLKAAPVMNSHIEFDRKLVRGRIDTFSDINISMPTILPNGQMTINLRDFGNKNLDEMTAYINDVRRRAEKTNLTEAMYSVSFDNTMKNLKKGRIFQTIGRLYGANFGKCKISHFRGKAKREYESIPETERLTIKDLEQGTVTVSNIGSTYLAQRGATALLEIVPPQVCALSVGAVLEKPLVVKKSDGRKEIEARNVLPICIAFDHRALDFGEIVPFMKRLDEIFENPSVIRSWVSDSNEKELFSVVA